MKKELKGRAVIYARYSSHNQRDISIEQQVALAEALAGKNGLPVLEVYSDRAMSGRNDNRPAFRKMMKDSEKGLFDFVISWKSSRIGRNMLEALLNEEKLAENGVKILYVEEDFEDNAAGRFAARSMMNVNQFYSESMAEDIVRGLRSNAEKCLVTGSLPYGYRKGEDRRYEIDPDKAQIVQEIFNKFVHGIPFAEIARSLNQRGIKTASGGEWNKGSFHRMLVNRRYTGVYIYQDIEIPDGIPRIISDELFYKTQKRLASKPNPQGRRGIEHQYLLTGKLYCGECKDMMFGVSGKSKSGKIYHYYSCRSARFKKGCTMPIMWQERIEQTVAEAVRDYILKPDVIQWIADSVMTYQEERKNAPEIGLLRKQLIDYEKSINNIIKAIEQGIITPTTKDRLLELEQQKEEATIKLKAAEALITDIPREYIVCWLESFRNGDVQDEEYLRNLFDSFLRSVWVYRDGRIRIIFDVGDNETETLDVNMDECLNRFPQSPPNATFSNNRSLFVLEMKKA